MVCMMHGQCGPFAMHLVMVGSGYVPDLVLVNLMVEIVALDQIMKQKHVTIKTVQVNTYYTD